VVCVRFPTQKIKVACSKIGTRSSVPGHRTRSDEMETAPNVKRSLFPIVRGIRMAGHQDARYIPPRREQDRSPRGWQDRFAIRRRVLAAVVMVVVALVTFMLIYGHA